MQSMGTVVSGHVYSTEPEYLQTALEVFLLHLTKQM